MARFEALQCKQCDKIEKVGPATYEWLDATIKTQGNNHPVLRGMSAGGPLGEKNQHASKIVTKGDFCSTGCLQDALNIADGGGKVS